jgi:hypothetical protein
MLPQEGGTRTAPPAEELLSPMGAKCKADEKAKDEQTNIHTEQLLRKRSDKARNLGVQAPTDSISVAYKS